MVLGSQDILVTLPSTVNYIPKFLSPTVPELVVLGLQDILVKLPSTINHIPKFLSPTVPELVVVGFTGHIGHIVLNCIPVVLFPTVPELVVLNPQVILVTLPSTVYLSSSSPTVTELVLWC